MASQYCLSGDTGRGLYVSELNADIDSTMTFSNQPVPQFVLLMALGLLAVAVGVAFVTDYKGISTRYAHRLSQSYLHGWQRTFVWTDRQRKHWANERLARRWVRIPTFGFILIGLIVLVAEIGAWATGHVT